MFAAEVGKNNKTHFSTPGRNGKLLDVTNSSKAFHCQKYQLFNIKSYQTSTIIRKSSKHQN